jgi:hypothetical protein
MLMLCYYKQASSCVHDSQTLYTSLKLVAFFRCGVLLLPEDGTHMNSAHHANNPNIHKIKISVPEGYLDSNDVGNESGICSSVLGINSFAIAAMSPSKISRLGGCFTSSL